MFKKIKTATGALAALALAGTTAPAGGLSDQIVEAPVVEDVVAAPVESSVPSWLIPVLIFGALVGFAASGDSDSPSDSKEESSPTDECGLKDCEL